MTRTEIYKESKYINFNPYLPKKRTRVWSVNSKSSYECLGWIRWYAPWRQYCFLPEEGMIFSGGCLQDIVDFIKIHKNDRVDSSEEKVIKNEV